MSIRRLATQTGQNTPPRNQTAILAIGAIGVVFGDIGTSPLYAYREALAQAAGGGPFKR